MGLGEHAFSFGGGAREGGGGAGGCSFQMILYLERGQQGIGLLHCQAFVLDSTKHPHQTANKQATARLLNRAHRKYL